METSRDVHVDVAPELDYMVSFDPFDSTEEICESIRDSLLSVEGWCVDKDECHLISVDARYARDEKRGASGIVVTLKTEKVAVSFFHVSGQDTVVWHPEGHGPE